MAIDKVAKPSVVKLQAETVNLIDRLMCSKKPWPDVIAALAYLNNYVGESLRLASYHHAYTEAEKAKKEAAGG